MNVTLLFSFQPDNSEFLSLSVTREKNYEHPGNSNTQETKQSCINYDNGPNPIEDADANQKKLNQSDKVTLN